MPHCSCGGCNNACFEKFVELQNKDYVFKFLNGLSEQYASVRSQIIMMRPFPSLDEVYNRVITEESQRTHTATPISLIHDSTVMLIQAGSRRYDPNVVCNYCKRKGHIKAECYKLKGYPRNHKFANRKMTREVKTVNHVSTEGDAANERNISRRHTIPTTYNDQHIATNGFHTQSNAQDQVQRL